MNSEFDTLIQSLKDQGLYKKYHVVESAQGAYLTLGNKKYLNLCSNNYLGLASDDRLRQAAIEAIRQLGVGTTSVRALIGTNTLHVELEKKLAAFKHAQDALVLTGGYLANMAVVQTLLDKEDIVFSDELNHASIVDAIKLSGVINKYIYKHCDCSDLQRQIEEARPIWSSTKGNGEPRRILIVSDGVFSMDGDIAPVPELVTIADEIGALLMIDDAHGEGVLGDHGRGVVDHFGLHGRVAIEVGTLSKAFGVMGGFVTGDAGLIDYLRQKARQFLFTNALSIPDTAALIAAVDILSASDTEVKRLWENANYLKKELQDAGFDTGLSETPIIPVMLGDEATAKLFAEELFKRRVMATPIVFPMVAKGTARLRLQPSAIHTKEDVRMGIEMIKEVREVLSSRT
ncbi:MAG: putative pyridoxal phosphate-dependent acyltransferase [Microgenomates bacterium OLB22]|nr:MAG: putative pyridoxal phosphate-dependent acyltransferase [Microgenomates bacterium OLB22]